MAPIDDIVLVLYRRRKGEVMTAQVSKNPPGSAELKKLSDALEAYIASQANWKTLDRELGRRYKQALVYGDGAVPSGFNEIKAGLLLGRCKQLCKNFGITGLSFQS